MRGVAQISFSGGGMFLPSRTPYERELVFEHAESYARRYGKARLQLSRNFLLVSSEPSESNESCAECGQSLRSVTFATGGRVLCRYCARVSS